MQLTTRLTQCFVIFHRRSQPELTISTPNHPGNPHPTLVCSTTNTHNSTPKMPAQSARVVVIFVLFCANSLIRAGTQRLAEGPQVIANDVVPCTLCIRKDSRARAAGGLSSLLSALSLLWLPLSFRRVPSLLSMRILYVRTIISIPVNPRSMSTTWTARGWPPITGRRQILQHKQPSRNRRMRRFRHWAILSIPVKRMFQGLTRKRV